MDVYRFAAAAMGRYAIETQGPTDVVMALYGPNNPKSLVTEDDDGGHTYPTPERSHTMGWQKATYAQVRSKMKPGDVITFGGKGNFSEIIKWATRSSVSHVGVIMQSRMILNGNVQPGFFNQIIESTSLKGFSGVTISRLSDRIKHYHGEIWWLPLSAAAQARLDYKKFFNFCLHQKGKPYDMPQAVKSALDALDNVPLIGGITHNVEDFSNFFCSELVAGALEKGGVIKKINASEVTPIDLCMFKLYKANHFQLKGPKKVIHGYNTQDPEGFGM